MSSPKIFCVLRHSPGPKWAPGVGFREQPGVEQHVGYMAGFIESGFLVIGGPFLDDSGGMMVCKTSDLDEARSIAEADPTVQSGLLNVEVLQWMTAMSSIELP